MQPAPKVKNPVSLVGVPPRLVKKEVGKNLSEQTQIADGETSNLKALQLKGLSRSPSQRIKRARSHGCIFRQGGITIGGDRPGA
ncbi:hypothetical protein [Microcoleus sp. D2_18a_B4]|uniref:hypothetical protein n=1 Tax=Microcoleus sp. D2_18a_B4 TaxID=3055329 RepID=UPI002FD3FD5E